MIGRKSILKKKGLLLSFAIIVVAVLIIYSAIFTPLFSEIDDGKVENEDEWHSYPYVIPGTDIRFPDDEGHYAEGGETWISVGFKLDLQNYEWDNIYMVILYHETYKDVYISHDEGTYIGGHTGEQNLPMGKMNMTFDNLEQDMPKDLFRVKEGEAFHYDFESYFELGDRRFGVNIDLDSRKPPATMTDFDGRVNLGDGYYKFHALTHCKIIGSITIDDVVIDVEGIGWVDNQRGSFRDIEWQWFAFWGENDIEMKIVDAYGGEDNIQYGMYVDEKGEIVTVKDISIDVTSFKNGFGYSWEITSEEYPIELNITSIDERMTYGWFAFGFGRVRGELMGEQIDNLTYIELTNR